MTDDQGKTPKKEFGDRLGKAKGRLQQSFPEIRQLVRTSNAVDVARKIIDPAQSIFRQFADDIQLKDLLAKAESIVANANRAFTKPVSKETPPSGNVSARDVFERNLKESGGKENAIEGNTFEKSGAEEDAVEKEDKAGAKTGENTRLTYPPGDASSVSRPQSGH